MTGDYRAEPGWRRNMRIAGLAAGGLTVDARDGGLTMRGRFGALRRPAPLTRMPGGDDLHFRMLLRGAPYDGVPMDVVFVRGADGRISRVDLGLLGARFHRRA